MSDDEIRKAVEADFQQFLTDSLTPDRGYSCPPIDNVKALIGELARDRQRLEWLAEHEGMITRGERAKTRREGLTKENLEPVWQIDWEAKDGSLICQTADGGKATFREAIDAAMMP